MANYLIEVDLFKILFERLFQIDIVFVHILWEIQSPTSLRWGTSYIDALTTSNLWLWHLTPPQIVSQRREFIIRHKEFLSCRWYYDALMDFVIFHRYILQQAVKRQEHFEDANLLHFGNVFPETLPEKDFINFLCNLFNLSIIVDQNNFRFRGRFPNQRAGREYFRTCKLHFYEHWNGKNEFGGMLSKQNDLFKLEHSHRTFLNKAAQKPVVISRKHEWH